MKEEVDEGGATVAAAAVPVESAAGPAKPMAKPGQNPLSRKLQRVLGGGGGGGGTVGPEVRTNTLSLSLSFALWLSRLDNASALGCSTTAQHSMDRLAVVSIVELLGRSSGWGLFLLVVVVQRIQFTNHKFGSVVSFGRTLAR
jgi:hypothetical protein